MHKLMNYKGFLSLAFIFVFAFALVPSATFALGDKEEGEECSVTTECVTGFFCTPDDDGLLVCSAKTDFGVGSVGEDIELGDKSLDTAIIDLINLALSFLGMIAVIVILIGGFKWMTAGGNDEKVGEARKWIFSGIIGLAIVLSAWAISKFVIQQLAQATGSGTFAN